MLHSLRENIVQDISQEQIQQVSVRVPQINEEHVGATPPACPSGAHPRTNRGADSGFPCAQHHRKCEVVQTLTKERISERIDEQIVDGVKFEQTMESTRWSSLWIFPCPKPRASLGAQRRTECRRVHAACLWKTEGDGPGHPPGMHLGADRRTDSRCSSARDVGAVCSANIGATHHGQIVTASVTHLRVSECVNKAWMSRLHVLPCRMSQLTGGDATGRGTLSFPFGTCLRFQGVVPSKERDFEFFVHGHHLSLSDWPCSSGHQQRECWEL